MKGDEIGWACVTRVNEANTYRFLVGKHEGKSTRAELCVDRRAI
jgi:hypothetical protein